MNAVDVMLQDEVGRLMDRLAATVPGGSLEATSTTNPALRARLDDMEVLLATSRAALLEDYGRWRRVLDDLENLWALAAWASAPPEQPAGYAAPRAA
ncbi:MAG TPA: hypothetical protein VGQ77_06100 [Methylomirabilota bacterium]|jgi:hypothetical protein|nr:hypothetical protein [Methylomirabilota bacterium]